MAQNLSWKIDPSTGDYVLKGGSPVIDYSLGTPAFVRLRVQRTRWLYAPDTYYGSDYYTTHVRTNNSQGIDNIGTRALQPLVDQNRATSVLVQTEASSRVRFFQQAKIVENDNQITTFNFTPVGNV